MTQEHFIHLPQYIGVYMYMYVYAIIARNCLAYEFSSSFAFS